MDLTPLINLGMDSKEAQIYATLVEEPSTAGKIADKTHLHRRTVYDLLNSLKEKGFVSYFEKNKVLTYSALNPDLLLSVYKEKEPSLKEIISQLKLKEKQPKKENTAKIYQGIKAIKTIFEEILENKEYIAFGEGMKTVEFLGPFFDYFQQEKRKRKIQSKILMNEQFRKTKTVTGAFGNFRFLSEYSPPTLTYVYSNKVAIIMWSESPTAFLIDSKEASTAYKSYFNIMWKIAKN